MELLSEYGLFLAKIVTVVLAIAAIAAIIVNVAQRNKRQRGELRVNNLSEQYKEMKEELAAALMDSHQQKQWHKAQKKCRSRTADEIQKGCRRSDRKGRTESFRYS